MAKILVADDHELVRMGIVRMLEDVEGFEVVGEAKTGEEAVELARELQPCVILMDVRMPGIGGLEATRKIQRACESAKVIAVTSVNDEMFTERLMKAGACGYVTKGAGFEEIVSAISAVLNGQLYMSRDIAQQVALRNVSSTKLDASPFESLSERELETAIRISNGEKVNHIAEALFVAPKTVNSYRYRIFTKLKINSDVELALLAVKHKLLDIENLS
ncbi:MAG: DNA-binding response regulator [Alteromonadaceae bacterium]|nr:MAG: DNA-binding response regulator [Alteromonadaceae bacterium]